MARGFGSRHCHGGGRVLVGRNHCFSLAVGGLVRAFQCLGGVGGAAPAWVGTSVFRGGGGGGVGRGWRTSVG